MRNQNINCQSTHWPYTLQKRPNCKTLELKYIPGVDAIVD